MKNRRTLRYRKKRSFKRRRFRVRIPRIRRVKYDGVVSRDINEFQTMFYSVAGGGVCTVVIPWFSAAVITNHLYVNIFQAAEFDRF